MIETFQYPERTKQKDASTNLWTSFLEGNKKALSNLYHVYYPSLLGYGLRLAHNEELIKDSIQELFLYMWEHRNSISHVHSVKSYLLLSLRRVIFVHIQKEKSRYQRNKQYVENLMDERKNIEDILIAMDNSHWQSEQIRQAYSNLSKRQQEVVHLKYFDGMTTHEICSLLGIKRQSVYNCLSEAITKLQKSVIANQA